MCGISGIASKTNITEKLFTTIRNLEYRGYDSCGIAIISSDNNILIRKNVGTVDEVNLKEKFIELKGNVGIAHTRWATHGGVTKINAHPHISCDGKFVLAHNGIISNYKKLKDELIEAGHKFVSETDTEVVVHLIEEFFKSEKNVERAFVKSVRKLEGTYGIAMISSFEPQKIFCVRKESPLILGISSDCNFIASDINAFIEYTKNMVVLNDGEYAIITNDTYLIKNLYTDSVIDRKILRVNWDAETSKKGGFPHYMLKEIHEEPKAVETALSIPDSDISDLAEMIMKSSKTYLMGVGTTYYVSMIGAHYFSSIAGTFIPTISSDEFEYMAEVDENSLVIAVSQSGETYDTLKALRYAKSKGSKTAAIVNIVGSSMSREVDKAIMQGAGAEICVLSTKTALSQAVILVRVAIELAYLKKRITQDEKIKHLSELKKLPSSIQGVLDKKGFINDIAIRNYKIKNWLFIGRGVYHPVALESALKFKEVTYLHAEGMSGGFMKHGTISLIEDGFHSVSFTPPSSQKELFDATMSNVHEIKARKGFIIGFYPDSSDSSGVKLSELTSIFNESIVLPPSSHLISPLLELVVGQLFAYFTAVALGRNVDKPRSLAKSVTVA